MSLSASGLADAITAAQGPAEDPAKQQSANMAIATGIINYLLANTTVTVTIPAAAIATTGGPTNQVGPAAPVPITGNIS